MNIYLAIGIGVVSCVALALRLVYAYVKAMLLAMMAAFQVEPEGG